MGKSIILAPEKHPPVLQQTTLQAPLQKQVPAAFQKPVPAQFKKPIILPKSLSKPDKVPFINTAQKAKMSLIDPTKPSPDYSKKQTFKVLEQSNLEEKEPIRKEDGNKIFTANIEAMAKIKYFVCFPLF